MLNVKSRANKTVFQGVGLSYLPLSLACAALAVCTSVPVTSANNSKQARSFPSPDEIRLLLEQADVPGVALATLSNCAVEQVISVGSADLARGQPVQPNTVFEAASLSKPVFAWLVMSLVDEGKVVLDQPIAQTLDYARIRDKAAYAEITPRMILSHRTGLPNWVGEDVNFYERTQPVDFISPPGERFTYSGEAFQLLQAFVEESSGQTIEELFRARLGQIMPNSSWVLPLRQGGSASRGYGSADPSESGRVLGDNDSAFNRGLAAGSLMTTAADYGAFLGYVCERKGLRAETYDTMFAPVTPVPANDQAPASSYGLGWNISTVGSDTLIGHDGNNDEYRAYAGILPELREGIVVLTNGSNGFSVIGSILSPPPPDPVR